MERRKLQPTWQQPPVLHGKTPERAADGAHARTFVDSGFAGSPTARNEGVAVARSAGMTAKCDARACHTFGVMLEPNSGLPAGDHRLPPGPTVMRLYSEAPRVGVEPRKANRHNKQRPRERVIRNWDATTLAPQQIALELCSLECLCAARRSRLWPTRHRRSWPWLGRLSVP
jgi:hypothetical protein